jgi:hypothetical protein
MSRGPGRWQRELLAATSSVCVVPVSGVVKAIVPAPCLDDFASARRGAKQLSLAGRISALYAWSCPRCFSVQDRADPQPCCKSPRSMLAVTGLERRHLVRHPAPAPGGQAPAWVNAAPVAPAGLAVPTVGDVAALALRNAYRRLEAGETVSVSDVVALLKLQREIERDARPDAGSAARWHATVREILWTARHYLGDSWPAFAADLRASGQLRFMWGGSASPACPAGGSSLTGSSSVSSLSSQTMAG